MRRVGMSAETEGAETEGAETEGTETECTDTPPRANKTHDAALRAVDFHDRAHETLLMVLSRKNAFYERELEFALGTRRFQSDPLEKGLLAFQGRKAVGFILFKEAPTPPSAESAELNPKPQCATAGAQVSFHLVDKPARGRGVGTLLLKAVEALYTLKIVSIQVDITRDSAAFYEGAGYTRNGVMHPCSQRLVRVRYADLVGNAHIEYYHRIAIDDVSRAAMKRCADAMTATLARMPDQAARLAFARAVLAPSITAPT